MLGVVGQAAENATATPGQGGDRAQGGGPEPAPARAADRRLSFALAPASDTASSTPPRWGGDRSLRFTLGPRPESTTPATATRAPERPRAVTRGQEPEAAAGPAPGRAVDRGVGVALDTGPGTGSAGRGNGQAAEASSAGRVLGVVVGQGGDGGGRAPVLASRQTPASAPRQTPATVSRPRHRAFRQRVAGPLVAADCAAALMGAFAVRADVGPLLLAPLLGCLVPALRRARLYRPGFAPTASDEVPALALCATLAWGLVAVTAAATAPESALGWSELLTALVLTVLGQWVLRGVVHGARRRYARLHPGSTLIVGGDGSVREVAAVLHAHPEYGMHPVGIAATGQVPGQEQGPGPGHGTAPDDFPLPVLTGHGDITRAVIQNSVRYAVVAGPQPLDARTTATVRLLAAQGACVWQVTAGPGPGDGQAAPGHLWGFACRRLDPYPPAPPGRWGKRALDIVLASAALLALAPVLAGCGLAVRLTDGPGVLFRQERIGLGGRPFTLLKFRTLRPADPGESATRWSIAHDRRVSPVGRLLRRTSLDELPQFWNVLRGDMSLVGPRPERPYFVEQFSQTHPGYQDRHRMPVGITGLAQVHGLRGDTSIADRARFDNHYIDSWSLWQDVRILARTATSLFRFGGS
ncbi:exopolysaccharide biosynthesis polyprenyl glycosylphosphotransferase [Streptomyces sp. NPDC088910]|uniref:exopolysaccharide biosynthesis polyprenyl glycosylphosphotransferase n=1 Tax=Streptomyces sp. NPDC088910 TaxID=3365911 RepID=UPI00380A6A17